MNWRSLVRRLNPAAYERVKCEPCDGTGFELVDEEIRYRRRSPVHCEKCHGRGWHLVAREPD
jgi:DnaJ-class molecular chaperone